MYDVAVVGAGLIGAAAAKYLAKKGLKVALIGPTEAQGALGACYDEGRIYRIADPDKVWADLADLSIKEYQAIEREAGERFHHETGFLAVGDPSMDYIHQVEQTMASFGTEGQDFFIYTKKEDFEQHFPFLRLSFDEHSWRGLWQPRKAGHLSPRTLALIQAALARRNGADVIDTQLDGVHAEAEHWVLQLHGKGRLEAKKVLLAAGWNTSWLSKETERLDIKHQMSQAVLLEVSEPMPTMPVIILRGPRDPEEYWYVLPPIKYPDGRTYLKMGYEGKALNKVLSSQEESQRWMQSGRAVPELVSAAERMAKTFFPGAAFTGQRRSIVCITDATQPTAQGEQRPYIDFLQKGLAVASGGNGWAAKSSDHIGWLAAEMMSDASGWASDEESKRLFPKELFQACYKSRL